MTTMMDKDAFDNWVNRYAREIHDEYDINVPLSEVEIKTSSRLTRALGKAFWKREKEKYIIKISYPQYKDYGKERLKETIRHEWAHILQYKIADVGGHGSTFQYLSEKLDFPSERYEKSQNAKYRITCKKCNLRNTRTRMCKSVKACKQNKAECQNCGGLKWNVEKVNQTEVMRKLRENAFKSEEQNEWKKQALNNLKA
jgi:predicted SprT family Zn-dependent metalloprotease